MQRVEEEEKKKITVIRSTLFQNAAEKMRLLVLVLAGILNVLVFVGCQELSVIRHSDGDIFTLEGKDQAEITMDSTARISEFSLRENRRNRKLRTRDDFAQSVLRRRRRRRRKDRTGSDIKNNGKEERCLRRVSRGAVASTKEAGGEEGKKARNRLTMKLQCNDLTAVFHLARLYVAFCPSNHG